MSPTATVTEAGPWQDISEAPKHLTLRDRDGDTWTYDGDNWVTPETATLTTAYINKHYAPFVPVNMGVPLAAGSRVQFAESKRWWKVRAASADGRFAILSSPHNLQKTLFYTIIDNERGVRGPDDRVFSSGYESDDDVRDRMRELVDGEIAVSRRMSKVVQLNIAKVLPAPFAPKVSS